MTVDILWLMEKSHHKTRGSLSNPSPRTERYSSQRTSDGWDLPEDDLPAPRTSVSLDASRSIITRNDSPDVVFDRSINPYRGCEHGCVYCFARPSHAWLGLSPGLDFETRLLAKPDAPRLLEAELRRKSYDPAPIAIGTNTDPYQPIERERRIMRGILEVLEEHGHPVLITTKGALVARDVDILARMAARGLAQVGISVTTLDRDLARSLEPRASVPAKRLDAIRVLSGAGVPVTVMAAPVVPLVTDPELERILAAGAEAGACHAAYILLRLPREVAELMEEWLRHHMPGKAGHVLSLIRQSREGKLYDAQWQTRFKGTGTWADLIRQRFHLAARKLGLDRPPPALDCSQFRLPLRPGDQMTLF